MENNDEKRIDSKTKPFEVADGGNDEEVIDVESFGYRNLNGRKQSFGFGAEIPSRRTGDDTEVTKTNFTKIIQTEKTRSPELSISCEEVQLNSNPREVVSDEDEDSYLSESDEGDSGNSPERNRESDEGSSTDSSSFSDLSGLSEMSGRGWKPISPLHWVQRQMQSGANPRELLSRMMPSHQLSTTKNDIELWSILASVLLEPPRRQKLRHINTFDDVIGLIQSSKNIMVLTGAGVSVSCGIPDFRSSNGIYAHLAKEYPNLPDPQAMFDISYFSHDPRPFYTFARQIYPGQFKPSPCHRFIKLLEEKQKLLRNYTQNIDTLEQIAGIKNVIECHGSFSTATCTRCKLKCDADDIRADIFAQRIPVCPRCQPDVQRSVSAAEPVSVMELRMLVQNGIMKPDIVFFGEGLPDLFHTVITSDKKKCDLLIVIGSSLKVRPVALIPSSIPAHVPQILINREKLHHLEFDVELLGDSDVIINQICQRLGDDWKKLCFENVVLEESKELLPLEEEEEQEKLEESSVSAPDALKYLKKTLWNLPPNVLAQPSSREKLHNIDNFADVLNLVRKSKNIIVLTGAGVSKTCGIPDFRSKDGVYARLVEDFPELPTPEAIFDTSYFSRDPRPFYKFAREIWPGDHKPSLCHRFIKVLERKHKLLRNYTQNIDTLEKAAGIRNIIECHGSFYKAVCTKCKLRTSGNEIRSDVVAQRIPVCRRCQHALLPGVDATKPATEIELRQLVQNGIMKPEIVFFGESLPEKVHHAVQSDKDKCDLLIVMGSSLKVRPVALIPNLVPPTVPQVLINLERLTHVQFDAELLGDADATIEKICHGLGEDWVQMLHDDAAEPEDSQKESDYDDETDAHQLADMKSSNSNSSTDSTMRLAGAYCDSGIESATSPIINLEKGTTANATSVNKTKSIDTLPPDLVEEPMNTVDFASSGFHTFAERLEHEASTYAPNSRHLSIDNSKDSGIQCDTSNSFTSCSNASQLASSKNSKYIKNTDDFVMPSGSASATAGQAGAPNAVKTTLSEEHEQCPKRPSAAERLITGTFYCHKSSNTYVFPGAQVSWSSDSGEDDDDQEAEEVEDEENEEDANSAPLSPFLPPSVEEEMVNDITSSASETFAAYGKRRSAETTNSTQTTEASDCSPPVKRARSIEGAVAADTTQQKSSSCSTTQTRTQQQ